MVLCSGVFDGLHAGHVRYLRAAKALCQPGEPLWVSVAPDGYVFHTKHRPVRWGQADRTEAVSAVSGVDAAVKQAESDVAATIIARKPRLFVKGADWAGVLPPDVMDACAFVGCQIVYVHAPGRHTSETLTTAPAEIEGVPA